ncbi:MAG: hypothetical protein U0840_28710 [Gemmataceae bacterium]
MLVQRNLCLALLLVHLGAAVAQSPPKTPTGPKIALFREAPTTSLYSAFYLGDPGLQKELGLKPEQVKKLAPLVASSLQKMSDGGWDRKRRESVDRSTAETLAASLTPEQLQRLRQLTLQQLVRLKTGPLTLAQDAGVVEALKLTDEQKSALGQRKRPEEILTPEQRKTWEALLGKPYPQRLHPRNVRGANSIPPYGGLRPRLGILLSVPFEEELKLTEEQLRKIATMLEVWYDLYPDCSISDEVEEEKRLLAACESALTEAQRIRYRQVLHRVDIQGLQYFSIGTGAVDPFLYQPLVEAWKLTDAQKKERDSLIKAYLDGLRELAMSDTPAADLPGLGAKAWARTAEKLQALLTPQQKSIMAEMLGAPLGPQFQGTFYCPRNPEVARPPVPKAYMAREVLAYAFSSQLPKDIRPTAEQVAQLKALAAKFVPTPAFSGEFTQDLDEETSKKNAEGLANGLATILNPKQFQKTRELACRSLLSRVNGYLPLEVLNNEELLEPLKLTEAQKFRLARGAIFRDVLEPAQRETLQKIIGPLAPSPQTPQGPIIITRGPNGVDYSVSAMCGSVRLMQMRVIGHRTVQEHLKLTPDQKKAINELATKAIKSVPAMPKPSEDRIAWREKVEKHAELYFEPVSRILTETQNKQWKQIAYQRYDLSSRGLIGLLEARPIQQALKLTEEQIKRLSGSQAREEIIIMSFLVDAAFKLRPANGPPFRPLTHQEMRPIMDARMNRLLTAEQKATLKELLGEGLKSGGFYPSGGAFAPMPF